MGLIRRFSDLRKARAQAARTAGRLEDPAAAFDLAHERQLRALSQVRASAAQLVAAGKRLEGQLEQLRLRRARLEDQARRSLAEGREDQAVEALTDAEAMDRQIEEMHGRVSQLAELRGRLEGTGHRMESRVLSMRAQAESMRAQYGAARAAAAAGEAVAGLGSEDGQLELLVQQARDKILWNQARAEAVGELLERGTLSGIGESGGVTKRLEAAGDAERVRAQLAEMKAAALGPPSEHQDSVKKGPRDPF
jgi:phage shock protein A